MRIAALLLFASALAATPVRAETPVERGLYLVTIAGCNDCHTPGALLGDPDKTRLLAGSDVGFGDPASGVWIGGNLTPDKATGLGGWTSEQIVTALTTGKKPDGSELSPIMPWPAFSHLSADDARAIVAYLQSLPPIHNAIGGPFKAGEMPTSAYVSVTMPTAQYNALPKPK
jgi:mono/diheme cytochrome c family protein